jgi:hypothetical protein
VIVGPAASATTASKNTCVCAEIDRTAVRHRAVFICAAVSGCAVFNDATESGAFHVDRTAVDSAHMHKRAIRDSQTCGKTTDFNMARHSAVLVTMHMCATLWTSTMEKAKTHHSRTNASQTHSAKKSEDRFRECLQERASTRQADQLSSVRGNNGLSGNAALLEKIQIKVQSPSNQCHASEAGLTSQDCSRSRRVRSWRHTGGCRFRVKGYVCATKAPSRYLGRNLFPRGVFLQSTESAGSMAQRE